MQGVHVDAEAGADGNVDLEVAEGQDGGGQAASQYAWDEVFSASLPRGEAGKDGEVGRGANAGVQQAGFQRLVDPRDVQFRPVRARLCWIAQSVGMNSCHEEACRLGERFDQRWSKMGARTRLIITDTRQQPLDAPAGQRYEALKEALAGYGTPEIFNTDQGSQFTSTDFTDVLRDATVKISPPGRLLRNRLPGDGWTVVAAGSFSGHFLWKCPAGQWTTG